jgi:hypothetical protein
VGQSHRQNPQGRWLAVLQPPGEREVGVVRAGASCNREDDGPALHRNEDAGEVAGESRTKLLAAPMPPRD